MKQLPNIKLIALQTTVVLCFMSCSQPKSTDFKTAIDIQSDEKIDHKDLNFATDAADEVMLEVQLGQLALNNAASEKVRQLGQVMVAENSKANEDLRMLALQKNIKLPETLSKNAQKYYDDFTKKQGLEFDRAYALQMVSDHKKAILAFKNEANKGTDADLKSWASDNIPLLENHLKMATSTKAGIRL